MSLLYDVSIVYRLAFHFAYPDQIDFQSFAFQPVEVAGDSDIEITGVNIDSRLVEAGQLFMAMRGTQADGHAYIPAAIAKGATAILCEDMPEEPVAGITYIQVKDSEDAVGKIATTFYGNPTSKMELVGVTGTNGKTTIATLYLK